MTWKRAAGVLASSTLLAVTAGAQMTYRPEHLERARALHERALVLDTHSDVTPKFEDPSWDFSERHQTGHMDIPRMREAGFDAQFLSIYMGRTPGEGRAIRKALIRIDAVHQTVERHPDVLEMAFTAEDVRRIGRQGRIACLMGIEGGHIIENSLAALRMFHRLGCRYMTLTHSFNTVWADSGGTMEDVEPEHGGLNARGEEVVREMNRLGMMVDISHVSDATFWDAVRVSSAPVIASHSSVDGVFEHRRNLSDDMLRAVRDKGGVVMINFFSGYIDPEWSGYRKAWEEEHADALAAMAKRFKANRRAYWRARRAYRRDHPMEQTPLVVLTRHVEHAAKVMGWEHVGMGADWDGVSAFPAGIDHCGDTVKLTALLLARGAREQDLEKYLCRNLLRVMEACEQRARQLADGG